MKWIRKIFKRRTKEETMVNIGAVWAAIPNNYLAGMTAASCAYVGSILLSYRGDMFAAGEAKKTFEADKRPSLMSRPSIMEWMAKEDARMADGKPPEGRFNLQIKKAYAANAA